MRRCRPDWLGWSILVFAALALLGWQQGRAPLAVAGATLVALGVLTGSWARNSLTGVTYRRDLDRSRALFGEEVAVSVEFVNDKLLPLSWLQVDDKWPTLTVRGGEVSESDHVLTHLLPMLPYKAVVRRLTVVCDRRGVHTFGPALVRSGDPFGYGERAVRLQDACELIVYPKIFALSPERLVSRVALGSERAAWRGIEDPRRPIGVREYRPGDPLRAVDWRATARRPSIMVRVFEPSASPRVALFLDTRVPQLRWPVFDPPELEFTIALGASVLADLSVRSVGVGLFSTASVDGHPISVNPSTAPETFLLTLELLARASPLGPSSFADVLSAEAGGLTHGTAVVVVTADFPEPTLHALAELVRRRISVTVIAVKTREDRPLPPSGLFDRLFFARFTDDWSSKTSVDLVA